MSVSFIMRRADGTSIPGVEHPASCCLCAQFAPTWNAFGLEGVDVVELASHASPDCLRCGATGIEEGWTESLSLNLNNVNASALIALLALGTIALQRGVSADDVAGWTLFAAAGTAGMMTLPEARRRVMGARARFERLAPALVRAETITVGGPSLRDDGVVELRPVRAIAPAFTAEDLRERLERFADLLEEGARRGAVEVYWA
jgi:hypothetical protein